MMVKAEDSPDFSSVSTPPKVAKEEPFSTPPREALHQVPRIHSPKAAKEEPFLTPTKESLHQVPRIHTPLRPKKDLQEQYRRAQAAQRAKRSLEELPARSTHRRKPFYPWDTNSIEVTIGPLMNDDTHVGIHCSYDTELNDLFRAHRARWEPSQRLWILSQSDSRGLYAHLEEEAKLVSGKVPTVTWSSEKVGDFKIDVSLRLLHDDEEKFEVLSFYNQDLNDIYLAHGGCFDGSSVGWVFPRSAYRALAQELQANDKVYLTDKCDPRRALNFERNTVVNVSVMDGEIAVSNRFEHDLRFLYRSIEGSRFEIYARSWRFPVEKLEELLRKLRNEPGIIVHGDGLSPG